MIRVLSILFIISSLGCGLTTTRRSKEPPKQVVTEAPAPAAKNEGPLEYKKAKEPEAPAPVITAPSPITPHRLEREKGPVSAETSLETLKQGNQRYRKGFLRKDGLAAKDRARLATGQKPHAVVFSCSDSRVPPELVFDQKLGDIFVVRTAGQSADYGAIASIEYAIQHLGANLIVVMGHESCGAVRAAHGAFAGGEATSPYIASLVKEIQPRISLFASTPISQGALDESWANVIGAAKDLMAKSTIIRNAVETGEVKIARSLYHLGSGTVEWK